MKKQCFLIALVATLFFTNFLTAQQVRTIWNSKKSAEDKYVAIKDMKKISLVDAFAIAKIKFEAKKDIPGIIIPLRRYEGLLPSQKKGLEKTFPGIGGWYENLASERHIELFSFTSEITPEITLGDLEDKTGLPPATAIDRINYYTIRIQQELFASENMQIEGYVTSVLKLYQSLNKSDQDSLVAWGYTTLWQQQKLCYAQKQATKNCVCGGKMAKLPEILTCESKQLDITETNGATFDEPTDILSKLTSGDLSQVKKAKSLKLDIWGNVNQNIQKELVFLHLAALGETRVPEGSSINLIFLWNKSEQTKSNDYLKQIGLDSTRLDNLQKYYVCILGARDISNKKKRESPEATTTQEELPVPVKIVPRMSYTAKNLATAVTTNLYNELQDRESLDGTCLQAKAINDSTYEVILNGCDSTKQVFPIKKFEVPEIADFFNYCSNKIARELATIPPSLVNGYSIIVTGTADKLSYSDNQGLAQNRADYIVKHLGKNVQAQKIETATEIDLEVGRRYVALTFILKRTSGLIN